MTHTRFVEGWLPLIASIALMLPVLPVRADNHALIMWIGDYGDPGSNLPGIDLDASNARGIARRMGVPERNITEISNATVSRANISSALKSLTQRIGRNDKVFVYYSGHGGQMMDPAGGRCIEGLVARDPALFDDARMQTALDELGRKAGQVVMMNDSCFSGGAATTKDTRELDAFVPKAYGGELKSSTNQTGYQCGEAVNKMAEGLRAVGSRANGPQVLYIAASAANEVSYATRKGSVATQAWASCLADADTNRSGSIDGEELRQCAQRWIDARGGKRQTITVVGNAKLPLMMTAPADSTSTPGRPSAGSETPVDPRQTLEDIRASSDGTYRVQIQLHQPQLRIGKDALDFSVTSNQPGFLYVLHVGSDGEAFNLLFPNQIDSNNQIAASPLRLPRSTWRIKAGGPAGASHLLAVVSSERLNLSKGMDLASAFPTALATTSSARNLVVEATSPSGSAGRFGASEVVSVQEIN